MSAVTKASFLQPGTSSLPTSYPPSTVKVQSLYNSYILSPVRSLIRPLFLPLFNKVPKNLEAQMEKETAYFKGFWDPEVSLYPELSHHKEIKESFTCQNHDIPIMIKEERCSMECCVIELADCNPDEKYCNIVHVLGISSTIDNTIMHTYPLLAAYLDLNEKKPPVRFILINHYSVSSSDGSQRKPETLSEAGLALSEAIKGLEETYGTIDQLLAFSLGGIVTAASLKYFHKELPKAAAPSFLQTIWHQIASLFSMAYSSLLGRATPIEIPDETDLKATRVFKELPKSIIFDRAPSSIEKLSSRYAGGSLLLQLAKLSGWDVDVGKEISKFVQNCGKDLPSLTVINALQDHRFHGEVNLFFSPYIQRLPKIKKISSLLLDICYQAVHENAQHSLGLNNWYGSHIVKAYNKQSFLSKSQSLATAIIQSSIHIQR